LRPKLRVARNIVSQRSSTAKGSAPRRMGVRWCSMIGCTAAAPTPTLPSPVSPASVSMRTTRTLGPSGRGAGGAAGGGRGAEAGGEVGGGGGDPAGRGFGGRGAEGDDVDVGDLHGEWLLIGGGERAMRGQPTASVETVNPVNT